MVYTLNNKAITIGGQIVGIRNIPIPAYTYRFQFEEPQTAQSLSGIGRHGTWTKINDTVWEYTYVNQTWNWEFDTAYSGLLPSCMIIGDNTEDVQNFYECFTGQTNITGMHLKHFHGNVTGMFRNCTGVKYLKIDVDDIGIDGIKYGGVSDYVEYFEIGLYNSDLVTDQLAAPNCKKVKIGAMPYVTSLSGQVFSFVGSQSTDTTVEIDYAPLLTDIYEICQGGNVRRIRFGQTGEITNAKHAFNNSGLLEYPTTLDFSYIQDATRLFARSPIYEIPDNTNMENCTNFHAMCEQCTGLHKVPVLVFGNHPGTDGINLMFAECTALEGGALAFYVSMTGDINAWYNTYGDTKPLPYIYGFYSNDPRAAGKPFAGAYSTEPGWYNIPSIWRE